MSGAIINQHSDQILINLRKKSDMGYSIPHGGIFNYISSPNYFGEIIEWLGFAIIANSLPAFSFFIWTFANLAPRALDNHRWYKDTFKDYPPERKAIIPFILWSFSYSCFITSIFVLLFALGLIHWHSQFHLTTWTYFRSFPTNNDLPRPPHIYVWWRIRERRLFPLRIIVILMLK